MLEHHIDSAAHGVAASSGKRLKHLQQIFALDANHHKAVVERQHTFDDALGDIAFGHWLTNATAIHERERHFIAVELLAYFNHSIAHPVA